ncbi:hypothetical protein BDB00DRAFT_855804 [Zychaea mexicana]|uniref:uncharacterized protein n=1 Tax=Zychaea mexicana TaxID=64656 RepID=UPI0022FE2FD6|nr:uncharacterized protein BDB00DRAFT_855804 [Zychaea mexicana]KAI9484410.1 hypothetical protein BDB00DRAFT_855804 [Zychaea mexicana]
MASPSTNEVLFVIIIVVAFFILLGTCVFCVYRATAPTKRQREAIEQHQASLQAQQIQYITASQLESLRPPELAKQLYGEKQEIFNDNKRRSILNKFFSPHQQQQGNGMIRPSSVREPSFRPMQQPPSIIIDDAVAIRDAEIAALAQSHPPPAYGDNRSSIPVRFDQQPSYSEKH